MCCSLHTMTIQYKLYKSHTHFLKTGSAQFRFINDLYCNLQQHTHYIMCKKCKTTVILYVISITKDQQKPFCMCQSLIIQ